MKIFSSWWLWICELAKSSYLIWLYLPLAAWLRASDLLVNFVSEMLA